MTEKGRAKLPKPAEVLIATVLNQFLAEQRTRLKPSTMRKYTSVISLFESCMDSYGPNCLNRADQALFDQLNNAKGKAHREFCQIFGPERIPGNVGEFLSWYMIRKVIGGAEFKWSPVTVIKKLGLWLMEKGLVGAKEAAGMTGRGGEAARDLAAAERLCGMLADYPSITARQY